MAATHMNSESSRSHSVFTCIIESCWEKDSMTHFRFARLNLVDLAGSERWLLSLQNQLYHFVFFSRATLTCLLIQAEKLWCRGRSFERSSKYKQIFINSWVTNWKNCFKYIAVSCNNFFQSSDMLCLIVHIIFWGVLLSIFSWNARLETVIYLVEDIGLQILRRYARYVLNIIFELASQ